jgi:uncharacterized protein
MCSVSNSATAQSFDCTKAQSRVEKLICADAAVRELDEYLGRYYSAARAANPAAASCLQADQSGWLRSTRDACGDANCLKRVYLDRLAELDPLQPGATAITNLALPPVPSLVWVVPPAADRVAAPPNRKAAPFEATGEVINDIATNPNSEGIVLKTGDGKRIPLVMLMFLEGPTQDHLEALAKLPNATFRARGFAGTDARGNQFFEPSRCVFVHRLPGAK